MLGILLSFYDKPLSFVPVHLNKVPIKSLNLPDLVGDVSDYLDNPDDLEKYIHRIPLKSYKEVNFEHICKISISSTIMMESSIEKLFDHNLHYRLVRKIASSVWRYSYKRVSWNELVTSYNGIRGFKFPHPDFQIRLDYSTWFNDKGYSQYTRTYLDGVFGFLLYYKGQHVMTIGFSILAGRKIVIQQVQLKNRTGNRWLFKLPQNYLEYVVDLFFLNFPQYRIYLVDGRSAVGKYLKDYLLAFGSETNEVYKKELREKIDHLKSDSGRLSAFYSCTGKFKRTKNHLDIRQFQYHRLNKDEIHA